ncbi:MAG: DUF86 domain-containing protein [Bacillota bacterium]|jgi:uncharacterized protein with HEPN domain
MSLNDRHRIEHIRDYCEEIAETIQRYGNSFKTFSQDMDFQKSISFSLLQIGELSGGLSEEFRTATGNEIHWAPIRGMRNMIAHGYGSMSKEIIWETAIADIPALLSFCLKTLNGTK